MNQRRAAINKVPRDTCWLIGWRTNTSRRSWPEDDA
jgi:hypothetical protein